MTTPDVTDATWLRSTSSSGAGLEVATNLLERDGFVYVRNTSDPQGAPVLRFTRREWEAFIGGVNDGEFDV
jgi:hypothetical protein